MPPDTKYARPGADYIAPPPLVVSLINCSRIEFLLSVRIAREHFLKWLCGPHRFLLGDAALFDGFNLQVADCWAAEGPPFFKSSSRTMAAVAPWKASREWNNFGSRSNRQHTTIACGGQVTLRSNCRESVASARFYIPRWFR
jgi:hypothetical protein